VLLLDNCDHLIEEAAALVAELIGRSATVKVIVTSREPLHTDGEVCLTLSPLADADALTLLTERARAADTAFERSPHNEAALAELCRGVGGLPLALEILGPRLRTHTAAELVDVLDRRLLSWSDTRRQIADRHRSLRALMEDGVALLPDSEREALERLSQLVGGAWLDEAALLCHPDPFRGEDLIVSLIERSLLTRAEVDDRTRISMHSLVRAYIRECTAQAGHSEAQSARHAEWVAGLVAAAAAHWHHPEEVAELRRRRVDEGNMRALLMWTHQHRPERLASLVVQLWWYWFRVGAATEGRHWVSLAVAAAAPGSRDRAAALAAGGYLAWLVDDYDAARAQAEAALADTAADSRVRGFAHGVVARALGDTGSFSAAADSARLGVREYEQCNDIWGTAWLRRVAAAALFYGKVGAEGEALRECVRSRTDFAEVDDSWGVAGTLDLLSRIVAGDGDDVVIRDLAETALALMRQCGDTSGERYALHHLAELSLRGGLLDVAEQHAIEELELSERYGYQVGALQAALLLEDVSAVRGDETATLEWRRRVEQLTAVLGGAAAVSVAIAAERRAAPLAQSAFALPASDASRPKVGSNGAGTR